MASEFNNFKINFDDDDDKDIFSSSSKLEFEDISSSSEKYEDISSFIDFDSFAKSESVNPQKKKRGLAGVIQRINEWWDKRNGYQKAGIILFLTIFTLISLFVIWNFLPFELRGKLFCSAFGLMVLNLGVYICVRWNKRKLQTVFMSIISIVLCAVMVLTLFFWLPFLNLFYNFDHSFTSDSEQLAAVDPIDKNITNIALFGIDTRDTNSFSGNSDSIMILSINAKQHTVKIISIMRDSLVPIENNGKTVYSKINSAYARGGAELAVRTINSIFDLDITEYATVNFFGMANIIEAVGGIEAELTDREVSARGNNNHGINDMIDEVCRLMGYSPSNYYIKKSGKQILNGIQAVAYSRIRYVPNVWGNNNDYGRTERQRYVMEQLFNKALTMKTSAYPRLVKELIPYTVTSLSPDEIMSFAFNIMTKSPTFQQASLPHKGTEMRSPSGSFGSVVYYDLDYSAELIHAYIYEDITFDEYIEVNGITKNDWYRELFGYSSNSGSTSSRPSTGSDDETDDDITSELPDDDNTSSDDEDDTSSEDGTGSEDEDTSSDGTSSDDTDSSDSSDSTDSSGSSDSSGSFSETGNSSTETGGGSGNTSSDGANGQTPTATSSTGSVAA